jgi:hypothetical protein
MIESELCFSLGTIEHFINNALGLSYEKHKITGFELISTLTEAAAYNTYIETMGDKADILYLRIKESYKSMIAFAYLNYISRFSKRFELNKKQVILAFDYTNEEFYGDVNGLDIHGWTGKDAITGHFKFLSCSIISEEIPQKIPLISLPIMIGHFKSSVVEECLSAIKNYVGDIKLILFDKEFYDNDMMYELTKRGYPFLIFVKKFPEYKRFLEELEQGKTIVVHDYTVKKNKAKQSGEKYLAFLKEIYDSRSEKIFDWIFATNVEKVVLGDILSTYKQRWRIETQFRVQDEARIKCKSKEMKIRYFLFLFEQLLQTIWIGFYKEKYSFKEFLIKLAKQSKKWAKRVEK